VRAWPETSLTKRSSSAVTPWTPSFFNNSTSAWNRPDRLMDVSIGVRVARASEFWVVSSLGGGGAAAPPRAAAAARAHRVQIGTPPNGERSQDEARRGRPSDRLPDVYGKQATNNFHG
jgi:hypothetical protein